MRLSLKRKLSQQKTVKQPNLRFTITTLSNVWIISKRVDPTEPFLPTIGVVRKTFRLRTGFLLQTLIPRSYFRNIIMTSGINREKTQILLPDADHCSYTRKLIHTLAQVNQECKKEYKSGFKKGRNDLFGTQNPL